MISRPDPNASNLIHPRAVLESVRKHTCYSGLRASITVMVYLLRAVAVLTAIVQGCAYAAAGGMTGLITGLIVAGVGLTITWFLVVLARDLLFLLVDIADTLVAGHALRRQEAATPQQYERAIS